jgi:predicted nuclease with RNAse H fold
MSRGGPKVNAVGIDAPLFWSPSGDRTADQIVRKAVTSLGCSGGTVSSVNSLQGACLIQGMLVAMMCRQRFADGILITEAHPKALLWLLGKATSGLPPRGVMMGDLNEYVAGNIVEGASEHERDAVLGAIAVFAMESQRTGWQDLYSFDSITPLNPPPGYWMPLDVELRHPRNTL